MLLHRLRNLAQIAIGIYTSVGNVISNVAGSLNADGLEKKPAKAGK